jgi:hypothetical protein
MNEQARFPGSSPISTKRTMPKAESGISALASLLDGSTAGELIPELATRGLHRSAPQHTNHLAAVPHQSEARLPADLLWVRSRRCAGAVVGGWQHRLLAPLRREA